MGKIFGISDLPVSIFTTPFNPVRMPKPDLGYVPSRKMEVPSYSNIEKHNWTKVQKYASKVKQYVKRIIK